MVENVLLGLFTGIIVVMICLAAVFTIRTAGAAPQVPAGIRRLRFRQPLAVLFWLLLLAVGALLNWADGSNLRVDAPTIVALLLVGAFFSIPVWRAAERFQGKPWSRRMTVDFTISLVTLLFSGWGLIQLALRDADELQFRLLTALIVVLVLALFLPVGLRRIIGGAGGRSGTRE